LRQQSNAVPPDDYRHVLEPVLWAAAESGEIRTLYLIDDDLDMDSARWRRT
jgi:hypothetical protein